MLESEVSMREEYAKRGLTGVGVDRTKQIPVIAARPGGFEVLVWIARGAPNDGKWRARPKSPLSHQQIPTATSRAVLNCNTRRAVLEPPYGGVSERVILQNETESESESERVLY